MDLGVIILFAAFIVYLAAVVILAKLYGPERAKEIVNAVKDATDSLAEMMKESANAVREIVQLAREKKEEGE
jgi:archaellum component FlaG (FlaF/FlaG flagellin family)